MEQTLQKTLTHLPERLPINIEFQDLTYSVFAGRKVILRSINGYFRSGQLTAILGPSGAGKSTLLNILAGYRCTGETGLITVNGVKRDLKQFHKISRYIMQEDVVQPWLTVMECMLIAADLKLTHELSKENKLIAIMEVLDVLRLTKIKDTSTNRLSGGEKKRLSIALELVNNPPLIFLDEPTTGLDDMASSQCITLLKFLAQGGRTVICSIHSPSAKLFAMFDHVYLISEGQCAFQGIGSDIVPFLSNIGLNCPKHYNPADFMIEVASGEYGYYADKMIASTENGRRYNSLSKSNGNQIQTNHQSSSLTDINQCGINSEHLPKYDSSTWKQFKILTYRICLQASRDKTAFMIKTSMYSFLALIIGLLFIQMGQNAQHTFPNLCYIFSSAMVFMYCSLLPALLYLPLQIQLIKREYFNRWYNINAFFWATTITSLPNQLYLAIIYIGFTYLVTDQPLELERIAKFSIICLITGMITDAFGLAISSTLGIVNGIFIGPVLITPLLLLAGYGIGQGDANIPFLVRIAMRLSFLRYGMEGLTSAIYSNREKIPCPDESEYCMFTHPQKVMDYHSLGYSEFWFSLCILICFYIIIKAIGYYLLRQRLAPGKTFTALRMIGIFVKNRLSITR